uniref:Immunoglobulin V-set domain-containing protein n=1 Tax=Xiphophorus maculatus TaxID=8083 RepID=A0A3B5QHH1_XIPMA
MILFILCCVSLHITLVSGMKSLPECSLVSKVKRIKTPQFFKLEDKQLQLLGYRYKDNTNPEPGTDVKLEMDGSGDRGETCTLTIKELSEKSSAVYYCAASYHSAEYHCCSVQKPPHRCSCVSCGVLIVLGFHYRLVLFRWDSV